MHSRSGSGSGSSSGSGSGGTGLANFATSRGIRLLMACWPFRRAATALRSYMSFLSGTRCEVRRRNVRRGVPGDGPQLCATRGTVGTRGVIGRLPPAEPGGLAARGVLLPSGLAATAMVSSLRGVVFSIAPVFACRRVDMPPPPGSDLALLACGEYPGPCCVLRKLSCLLRS